MMTHHPLLKIRLLERLEVATPEQEDSMTGLLESIQQHLENLLNCRPGSCRSAPFLGVTDFNAAIQTQADIHLRLSEAIRHCIEACEPRLTNVVVNPGLLSNSPLQLSFQICGQLRFADRQQLARFRLLMDSQRHYRMEN